MEAQPFAYSRLPTEHIRLLGRRPSLRVNSKTLSEEHVESYYLSSFPVSDCPQYEAVSYCWGTESADVPCLLNGDADDSSLIYVTPHLSIGVRNAFSVATSEWLWIDAICISQSDEEEKAEQVTQMGKIFANARRVIIWLGADYEESDRVMRLMPILSSPTVLQLLSAPYSIDWGQLVELGLPECTDTFWVSLFDLLHRPWFERLWIIQEAVLAAKASFLVGTQTMSWDQLKSLSAALRDGDLIRDLGQMSPLWRAARNKFRSFRALTVVESVDEVKTLRTKQPWVAALLLLALIRKQISKEPLDYVYGILGLLPESCRARIIVDYSEASRRFYGRVYAQLFQALFDKLGDSALMYLNNIETPRGAPSWCPDLRSRTQPGYSSLRVPDIGAGCNPYGLGYQTPSMPTILSESADTIAVPGAVIDIVATVIPLERPGKIWSFPLVYNDEALFRTYISFHRCLVATQALDLPQTALARTLIGQVTRSEADAKRFTDLLNKTIQLFQSLSESALPIEPAELEQFFRDRGAVLYLKLLWSHWNGRSFFTTTNGRIGLGLRTIVPGDSVCMFLGAPKLFVMQPYMLKVQDEEEEKEIQRYRMIAECYVDGIMNGELFKLHDFENNEDLLRTFYIR